MKIELVRLIILNFKGIRSLDIPFSSNTDIYARNGAGKTSILDAWSWLITGKDSSNSSDFEIKTLDENNQPYHKLSHEVIGHMMIDGELNIIKKIYREKWTKKKGSSTAVHDGHTTEHFWNDVPMNETAFKEKINSLIPEARFKLLTNLRYFNEVLKWQDRRAGLLALAGGIEDIDVALQLNKDGAYDHLIKALNAKKSLTEYKSQIAAQIKKIKDDSVSLPARIDEARRGLPTEEHDYEALETELKALSDDLAEVESQLMDKTEAQKKHQAGITELMKQQQQERSRLLQLESNARNSIRDQKQVRLDKIEEVKREITSLLNKRSALTLAYNTKTRELESMEGQLATLKQLRKETEQKWDDADAEKFELKPGACDCPTCKRPLDDAQAMAEQLEGNFNRDKADRLKAITAKGQSINAEIESVTKNIALKQTDIANTKMESETLFAEIEMKNNEQQILETENTRLSANESAEVAKFISESPEIKEVRAAIESLQQRIDTPYQNEDNSELITRKSSLNSSITIINKTLAGKDQKAAIEKRIAELEKQESESGQALADLEMLQFSLLEFDKAKMDMLEERINGRFQTIKFKLFDRQVNGGESPTCVALINGVPYTDANTASRINANLDIINVFSQHFGIKAPVFIDNRESVTNIIDTDLQIINLIVSPNDQKIRVGDKVQQEAGRVQELFS